MTIHELRKQGYKVVVHHSRPEEGDFNHDLRIAEKLFSRKMYDNELGLDLDFYPPSFFESSGQKPAARGGLTEVHLTTPEGKNYSAKAYCNPVDTFSYKLGAKIALNRVLDQIKKEQTLGEVMNAMINVVTKLD